ncbi:Spo7-like protein [Diplocarpon rosae]|nr:Spo7-like protein [Diplocarpon rosae]
MSKLDQLVKGAPSPEKEYTIPRPTGVQQPDPAALPSLADPLVNLPSSPPQIYLNLLILEASLRAQWLQLRTRRRQHTFFLTLLGLWILYFGYALFFAPREDGSGVGGSVYWVVEVTEKVCLMGGVVTGILVWGTGQWERGFRWPRRWVGTTNRGLRGFNCKLVVIKQPVWRDILSTLSFLFSYGLISSTSGSSYRFVDQSLLRESEKVQSKGGNHALPNIHEDDESAGYDEDLAPGGDYVKLLLLPKPFSPGFRENWDIYRTEYWEKENERRAILRKKVKELERKLAKEQDGWWWWTGVRGWKRGKTQDVEKIHHPLLKHGSLLEKDAKRTRSGSIRSGSHSRNSSRSITPSEVEDGQIGHVRRGSNASSASGRRKKVTAGSRVQKLTPGGSRSSTPEVPSPLMRESSFTSLSSLDSERPPTPAAGDGDSIRSSSGRAKSGSLRKKPGAGSVTK